MAKLVCRSCGRTYELNDTLWKCECGGLLDIEYTPSFPIEAITARKPTMWRYHEAIPVPQGAKLSFEEGFTPMIELQLNGCKVYVKQEQLFPTGSFKDRGAAVLMSKVNQLGISRIVEDSSGNAGSAIAAYAAKAGIDSDIFVPKSASSDKLVQIQAYGAKIHKIRGNREEVAKAALEAAERHYYASHVWNPFFFHGTKTFAFEVWEQLGWRTPDMIFLPVGHGTLLLGAYLGFKDLLKAKCISELPKLIGVQAKACAPLNHAFRANGELQSIEGSETLAEGIAIAHPVRGKQILQAVEDTNGTFLTVKEAEIKRTLKQIGKKGFYIEPTSAVVLPAIRKYDFPSTETVIVSAFTGHGLKATKKMRKILSMP